MQPPIMLLIRYAMMLARAHASCCTVLEHHSSVQPSLADFRSSRVVPLPLPLQVHRVTHRFRVLHDDALAQWVASVSSSSSSFVRSCRRHPHLLSIIFAAPPAQARTINQGTSTSPSGGGASFAGSTLVCLSCLFSFFISSSLADLSLLIFLLLVLC